jgi:LPS-assembly lipoprotein
MRQLAVILLLLLAGCGFKPSNVVQLNGQTGPFSVSSDNIYSSLADNIERAFNASGARVAQNGEPTYRVVIVSENTDTRALSINEFAQVREFVIRYTVVYSLSDPAGKVLIDNQTVVLRRVYTYDSQLSVGSPAEEALLIREMQDEMIRAILRRTSVVLQSTTP